LKMGETGELRREEELGDFLATHFHDPFSIT
jgi:hypothetical protein